MTASCAGASCGFGLRKTPTAKPRTLLRRAIELDPRFAPAYAFLGAAHVIDYVNGWSASPAQALEEAEKAARQAVQLDERHPYALWALALVCLWARRYDEAIERSRES